MEYVKPYPTETQINDKQQLQNLKLLIVGVGGIGCELLKVLCKMPIGLVHVIDMDTIEISNLNRQFLFKSEHKGQSKALVAEQTIKKINPAFNIVAHHKNIRELPISFFKQFTFLIMALDNIETRNYVNKIGVRLGITTIDAGTLGYKGNVHLIIPKTTKCYSCQPKVSSQKSYPVCTIRMRPEKPIHCIVWAKMLFEVLFSGQEVNNDMKDLAVLAESGDENSVLKQLLFTEILNIKNAKTDSDSILAQSYVQKIKPIPEEVLSVERNTNLDNFQTFDSNKLQLKELVSIAKQSFVRLLQQKKRDGSIIFEKDDDNIIHFISSLANLRMSCFSISLQSFNEVKNMAGNIVPAIASTNSIVSGLQVIQMIKLVKDEKQNFRSYYIQNQSYKVRALKTQKPLPDCSVCSQNAQPITLTLNMLTQNFSVIVSKITQLLQSNNIDSPFSINLGEKQLYLSEEPNKIIQNKKIIQITNGALEMDLMIGDEDTSEKIFILWVVHGEEEQVTLENQSQIQVNIQQKLKLQAKQNEQKKIQAQGEEDDDGFGFVEDGAAEDDLEIVGFTTKGDANKNINGNKNGKQNEEEEVSDVVQKRIKYD